MNRQLHGERIFRGSHRRRLHRIPWRELPDGAFVRLGGEGPAATPAPALVLGDRLVEWTREGYGAAQPRPTRGEAETISPPSSLAALRAGYPPQIDVRGLRALLPLRP